MSEVGKPSMTVRPAAPRIGRPSVGADRHADAMLEGRIQIPIEEVRRFHDVHVGVDETEPVLHLTLP